MSSALLRAVLGIAVLAAPLRAQDPVAAAAIEPDRWDVALDFGFNGSTGNTRLTVLSAGIKVKHLKTELYELEWNASFRYGESEGDVVARAIRASLGADYRPQATWSPFLFTQIERDPFRKLELRSDAGMGVKHTFTRSERSELSLSVAAVYNRESFVQTDPITPVDARTDARWSVRARGSRQFGSAKFENTTFFKPVWDSGSDYDVDVSTSIALTITERIAAKFSHLFRRDSTPPPDVEKNDQVVQAGITLTL